MAVRAKSWALDWPDAQWKSISIFIFYRARKIVQFEGMIHRVLCVTYLHNRNWYNERNKGSSIVVGPLTGQNWTNTRGQVNDSSFLLSFRLISPEKHLIRWTETVPCSEFDKKIQNGEKWICVDGKPPVRREGLGSLAAKLWGSGRTGTKFWSELCEWSTGWVLYF